ncbi:MAG TPA: lysophospholipid acyltransferase family protein [Nitriliruptorales bacterium]|nr:lysophospholipid acyltransferase family protein [Nitriliruptorales bacterium]
MTEGQDARIYSIAEERAVRAAAREEQGARPRCGATTAAGRPCRNYAVQDGLCRVHAVASSDSFEVPMEARRGDGGIDLLEGLREVLGDEWAEHVEAVVAFLRRRLTGRYPVDDFGFDRELTERVLLPLLRPMYRRYWRVRGVGHERVPDGGALVVANHAGTLPADALMVKLGLYDEVGRHLRLLGADLVWRLPFVGELGRKMGSTMACNEDALRLLRSGELVGVWPEGFKGIGKLYRDRYKLQRFGRGGFVEVALRAGTPIVPTAIVGSEEIYPLLYDFRTLARLFGVPYFPLTFTFPWLGPLGLIPLPSKWIVEYGEPIDTGEYGPDAADDPMAVFDLTDRVRDTIQQMLYRNLMGRRSMFL